MVVTDSKGATAPIEGSFGRFVPDSSQRTAEQLVTEIKEVWGDDPPVVVQPMVKQAAQPRCSSSSPRMPTCWWSAPAATAAFAAWCRLGHHHVAGYAQCSVTIVR